MKHKLQLLSLAAVALLATSVTAQAALIGNAQGKVNFPDGAVSFADAVVAFNPVIKNGEPGASVRVPEKAVGLPDFVSVACSSSGCSYVSLGDGGSITLRFIDNRLTGSGNNKADLWIFEVGPDVEDTFVEISTDGVAWSSVGKVGGSVAGVDIDAFGFGISSRFAFVRLTDDPLLDAQSGSTVGADIDAVGAISTVAVIPEPATWALMLGGLAAVGGLVKRRAQRQ